MSHFSKLIDESADQKNHSLSDVLLKAKVLASRLRSRKFRHWIDAEINGYDGGEKLPEYRIVNTVLEGYYGGYFGSAINGAPISTSHLEAKLRETFEKDRTTSGVSFIEDLVSGEDGYIGRFMDGIVVNYLRVHGTRISEMVLNRVFKRVSRHSLINLLSSVRARLLDFLLELRERYPDLDKTDDAAAAISETDVDATVERRVYQNCTVIEGSEMRDNFQAGQAGAMGPHAKAENMNFIQVLREAIGEKSLGDLASELEKVRAAMLADSKNVEQDKAVAAIAEAEDAAKKGNAKGVLGWLKEGGKWALNTATQIGTEVAAKAIEKAMTGATEA